MLTNFNKSLALASMARDDSPASSTAANVRVKWDRNLKPKLAIMRQCTSVRQTDRQTDGLASWHKREMYILHLVLKITSRQSLAASPLKDQLQAVSADAFCC